VPDFDAGFKARLRIRKVPNPRQKYRGGKIELALFYFSRAMFLPGMTPDDLPLVLESLDGNFLPEFHLIGSRSKLPRY
jgi:hypothetical protein